MRDRSQLFRIVLFASLGLYIPTLLAMENTSEDCKLECAVSIEHEAFSLILSQIDRIDHESCRLVCWEWRTATDWFLCNRAKRKKAKQITDRMEESDFGRVMSIERGHEEYKADKLHEAFCLFSYASSSEQGNAHATYMVGHMFLRGEGVNKSTREGLYQLRNSAESGFASAIYDLGLFYYTGQLEDGTTIIDINYQKAFEFFDRAHRLKNKAATYHLGRMYYYGHYVKEDQSKALDLIRQSANAGYKTAKETYAKIMSNL
jgi:TPR repeat protein